MYSSVRFTPVLTLLVACASATEDTASNVEAEAEVDAFDPVAQLAVMLSGEFDSSAQAAEMPSYYDVHLWGCDAEAPGWMASPLHRAGSVDRPAQPIPSAIVSLDRTGGFRKWRAPCPLGRVRIQRSLPTGGKLCRRHCSGVRTRRFGTTRGM